MQGHTSAASAGELGQDNARSQQGQGVSPAVLHGLHSSIVCKARASSRACGCGGSYRRGTGIQAVLYDWEGPCRQCMPAR